MTQDLIEAKVTTMESDIKEIKTDIKNLPKEIATNMSETIDDKIKIAIAESEKRFQGKFIALLLSMLGEAIGLVISFVR